MSQIYSKQELGQLLSGFNLNMPLSGLEAKLHRSVISIASKIERLAKSNPRKWSLKKVAEYKKQANETYKERFKKRLSAYLKENPSATASDVRKAGFGWDLGLGYDNRINDARRDAGIDIKMIYAERRKILEERSKTLKEEYKKKLINFLNSNPKASIYDIMDAGLGPALHLGYRSRLDDARKDAGILTEGYVYAAEASRILGVSRERVSQLFKNHEIDGYRLGRRVLISLDSIPHKGYLGRYSRK